MAVLAFGLQLYSLLNSVPKPEVSDTTDDDSSTGAGKQMPFPRCLYAFMPCCLVALLPCCLVAFLWLPVRAK